MVLIPKKECVGLQPHYVATEVSKYFSKAVPSIAQSSHSKYSQNQGHGVGNRASVHNLRGREASLNDCIYVSWPLSGSCSLPKVGSSCPSEGLFGSEMVVHMCAESDTGTQLARIIAKPVN